jgi:hypothetical protein
MNVLLTLEASQPSGKMYRLGFRYHVHLASIVVLLSRMF